MNSWFDDLYDHVLRGTEWTESLRDMVTTVFETNLSLRTCPIPASGRSGGFVLSISLIVAIVLGLCAMFKRRDWP